MSGIIASLVSIMAFVTKTLSYTAATAFALLAVLSPRSQKARMWLNVFIYVSSLGVCSVFGVIASIVMNLIPGQRLNINHVVARSFYLLAGTLTGVRFRVEGEENFAKGRPGVLVGNHQSSMDILYLGRIFPKYASIMAKQELKFAPLLGQFMLLSGAVFIDRKNRHDAVKAFNQVGDTMKRNKLSLWIFPEGTRSKLPIPDLLQFKKGAFHLAQQAQLPVIPVVCENYHRLFDSKTRFEGGTIRIKVLPPVETKGLTKDDVNELTDKVRNQMLEALKEMDRDREAFDVSSEAARPSSSTAASGSLSVASNSAPLDTERGLGGVAGWMAKLVGTGSGRNYERQVRKDDVRLRSKGTSGENPEDYNLVSEAQKSARDQVKEGAQASATEEVKAGEGLIQRRKRESASGNSAEGSDETEGSTVLVEAPEGQ